MIRHLLYSVYAARHSNDWLLNIQKLCKYNSVFNGKKIVIIRSDRNTVPKEKIIKAFNFKPEFIFVKNDRLHETSNFITTLGRFYPAEDEENEILFYAHTKGVQHRDNQKLQAIRIWRNVMYDKCLKDPKKIEKILINYPCAGCFLKKGPAWPNMRASRWHYSGNFWWVNLTRLFNNPRWSFVYPHTHAIEAYLGSLFNVNEAYNIAYPADGISLYYIKYLNELGIAVTVKKDAEKKKCKIKIRTETGNTIKVEPKTKPERAKAFRHRTCMARMSSG